MFDGWGNYYFLLGSAAAALIGVMALVATLTGGGDRDKAERGQRLFLTPTVFHLAAVLTLSGLTLAPKQAPALHLLLMSALVLYGLGYALVVAVQLGRARSETSPHWSDFWCYGAAPAALYAATEVSLLSTQIAREVGCLGFALCLLALLLTAVRNAWDLVTWLAPRRDALRGAANKERKH